MSSDISHRIPLTGEGRSLGGKISGGSGRPPANILIPLERQLNALQLCRLQFLYNETLQSQDPDFESRESWDLDFVTRDPDFQTRVPDFESRIPTSKVGIRNYKVAILTFKVEFPTFKVEIPTL